MSTYRKKPVIIEAHRWDGDWDALNAWLDKFETEGQGNGQDAMWENMDASLTIPTLEGDMRANRGDWIIRGVQGEFYPCKPEIFESTYEEVP